MIWERWRWCEGVNIKEGMCNHGRDEMQKTATFKSAKERRENLVGVRKTVGWNGMLEPLLYVGIGRGEKSRKWSENGKKREGTMV